MTVLITIIIVFVAVSFVTKKILKHHPLYGKANLSVSLPKAMIVLSLLSLFLASVACNIIYKLDSLRDLGNWGGMMGAASEVINGITENGGVLPTWERAPEVQQWIDNIDGEYSKDLWYVIICIVAYGVYLFGIFKRSKGAMWAAIIVEGLCVVLSLRAGVTGMAHLISGITSGVFNPYTGDMSDSIMIPFCTYAVAGVMLLFVIDHKKRIDELASLALAQPIQRPKQQDPVPVIQPSTSIPIPPHQAKVENVAKDGQKPQKETKTCPYCGEEIPVAATKCKYCGEWLNEEEQDKMITCPICGESIPADSKVCPMCNEPIN